MATKTFLPGSRTSSTLFRECGARSLMVCAIVALSVVRLPAQTDQVVMQNGDHYYGTVQSLTTNSLVLQSEVLGSVTLPRAKVKLVNFGTNASANALRSVASASPPTQVRPLGS